MMRRRYAPLIVALVLLGLPIVTTTAQGPRRASQPLQAAMRSLLEGRYEEVDVLTEKLDARDPEVVTLRGRARIARGRYEEAEALLKPVASQAPTSDAALELGLLEQMLGRAEARNVLTRVGSIATTSGDAAELARAGRALRALGRLQEANAAYREASRRAPNDPAVQTGWGELFLQSEQ